MQTQSAQSDTPHQQNSPVADTTLRWAILSISIALLVISVLLLSWYVLEVIMTVFAGLLLAILLRIPSELLRDHTPLNDIGALAVVIVVVLGSIIGSGWLLAPTVVQQITQLTEVLPSGVQQIRGWLEQYSWGQQVLEQSPAFSGTLPSGNVLSRVAGVFSGVFGLISNLLIIIFIGLFFAFQPQIYVNGIASLVPPHRRDRAYQVLYALGYTLKWWLISRVFSMVVIGTLAAIGLSLIGTPLVPILAIVSGLLSFIPFIGSIISVIPAALVALSQSPTMFLYVLAFFLVIQVIESNILTPTVQQQTVLIAPALGITVQLLMGVLGGVLAFVLAMPLTAVGLVLVKMLYVQDVLGEPADVPGAE